MKGEDTNYKPNTNSEIDNTTPINNSNKFINVSVIGEPELDND